MTTNPFIDKRQRENAEMIRIGTVTSVDGNNWYVQWDGESEALDTVYSRVDSYTPVAGDRVVGITRSKTYVILGKLVK